MGRKDKKRAAEELANKIIEVTAEMHGSLNFKDPVVLNINGKFSGKLDTKGKLLIGESAQVSADINGEDIEIFGNVTGNIFASKSLKLRKNSYLKGDIKTLNIEIETGSFFQGRCDMIEGNYIKMSESEVAEYLHIDMSKLNDWVNNNKIPVEMSNDEKFFDKEKIDRWITENKINV